MTTTSNPIVFHFKPFFKQRKMYSLYIIGVGGCLFLLTVALLVCHQCYKRRKNRRKSKYSRAGRPLPSLPPLPVADYISVGTLSTPSESSYITPKPRVVTQQNKPIREIENQPMVNDCAPPLPKRDMVCYENKEMMNIIPKASSISFIVNGNVNQINFIQGEGAKIPVLGGGKIRELNSPREIEAPALPSRSFKGMKSTDPTTSVITNEKPSSCSVTMEQCTYNNLRTENAEAFQVV